jgi:hypothetical protein
MPRDLTSLDALVNAACAIAFARENDDDTCEEWDDLNHALLVALEGASENDPPRWGFKGGMLMRWSRLASGALEDHACTQPDFEAIVDAIHDIASGGVERTTGRWFTVDEIARDVNRGWTTAMVAIGFLQQRGLVRANGTGRRLEVADAFTPEAALAEFVVAEMKAGSAAR